MSQHGTFAAKGSIEVRPVAEVIARMAELMAALPPSPPNEVRIHPDDIEELKRMFPRTSPPTPTYLVWLGTRVTEDADAPRLPRKAQP